MGLDIGNVRCGIAISDPGGRVSSPLKVIPSQDVIGGGPEFRRLIEDWEPEVLVCGLPLTLSGEEGKQAARIREACDRIASQSGIECIFVDERLSSKQAKSALHEMGYDERQMRGKVDMVAASIFLQAWLDWNAGSRSSEHDGTLEEPADAID